MSQVPRLILIVSMVLCIRPAYGQNSCLPDFTALQTMESLDPASPSNFVRSLISQRADGYFSTRVRLEGEPSGGALQLRVRFDPDFEGVSLPYNLYAVLVVEDGRILAWHDYTQGCKGMGLSFFPGRVISLPPIKLVGVQPQRLQIMVWGRL